jgi:hypothetical protein
LWLGSLEGSLMTARSFSLVFVIAMVLLCLGVGGVANGDSAASHSSTGFGFPLWKDVPGDSFAVLGKGKLHGMEWAAFASRATPKAKSKNRPCITVARVTEGRYANALSCGPLAPIEGMRYPPSHPLLGEVQASALAISVAQNVTSVDVELQKGQSVEHIRKVPKLLSMAQARKTGLARFRYLATAVPFDACILRIVGYSEVGEKLLDFESEECPLK